MNDSVTVQESCRCGATFKVTMRGWLAHSHAKEAGMDFRKQHFACRTYAAADASLDTERRAPPARSDTK